MEASKKTPHNRRVKENPGRRLLRVLGGMIGYKPAKQLLSWLSPSGGEGGRLTPTSLALFLAACVLLLPVALVSHKWLILLGVVLGLAGCIRSLLGLGRCLRRLEERCDRLARERASLEGIAERAREESRLESEFLANVSHDLRTPMNGIIGFTALALETDLSDEQRQYLESVRSCSESLLGLLNEILDFSKLEAGKLVLDRLEFDVRELLEGVADVIAPAAGRKGLEVVPTVGLDVPARVLGDPNRLRQVITNLAGNAVKFTERGEIEMRVAVARREGSAATLRFEIRDTGIGIPREEQKRVFERFAQAKSGHGQSHGGTGLGLAISKRLVDLMGGEIGVSSQAGVGSIFWFTARLDTATPAPLGDTASEELQGIRVLVVDDNKAVRDSLSASLRSFGCIPESLSGEDNPLEVLEQAVTVGEPYPAAIFDMSMPGMKRDDIARLVRREAPFDRIGMLVMSPVGSTAEIQLLRAGATKLNKPVKHRQLLDALLACVQTGRKLAPVKPPGAGSAGRAVPAAAGGKVLLAEDNVINQKLACRILEKAGYRVEIASSGREVIEALGGESYDVVLMDVHMPDMDGLDATAAVRRIEGASQRTPIIAMTADAREEDRRRCLAAGMDDYLSKPIRSADLLAAVERWMERASKLENRASQTILVGAASVSKASD